MFFLLLISAAPANGSEKAAGAPEAPAPAAEETVELEADGEASLAGGGGGGKKKKKKKKDKKADDGPQKVGVVLCFFFRHYLVRRGCCLAKEKSERA